MVWSANLAWEAGGLYHLSEVQAQEILQMRLQRLTGLEQDKIVAEYKEVMAEIDDLLHILATPEPRLHHHQRRTDRHQT